MSEKEQNSQNDFLIEKIKKRPINRGKLLRRTIITALMAVIFGLIACFTFLILEPVISNWLYPEEKPELVVFPEDTKEMLPEEMLAEKLPEESTETNYEGEMPLEEQIQNALEEVTFNKDNYVEIYSSLSEYVTEINRYMVTVTAVSSNLDWFDNIQVSKNQTSGLLIAENGKEVLILTDAAHIMSAEKLIVSLYNGYQTEAQVKQIDSYTNLAILAISFDVIPEKILQESIQYASLGSSNRKNILGTPVIAIGGPMGVINSVGYGMITTSNTVYSVPERNLSLIQTDINGSVDANGILFDMEGNVIGVITSVKQGYDMKNVVYAYGVSDLKKTLEKLSNAQSFAYLGISGINVSSEAGGEYGVPLGGFVKKVEMDSPAMRAGIQQGDVITNINGRNISTFNEYSTILMQMGPGEEVEMTVKRQSQDGYKEMNFKMETGEVKK